MVESNHPLQGTRVLIVEDESRVAMMLEMLLGDIGCVVAGMSGRLEDALAKAKSLEFDVALLDVNLDGESSWPVAEAIAGRGLRFVFATGYGSNSLPEALRGSPLLRKPYRVGDIERALQAALPP